MAPTRFREIGYRQDAPAVWRFVDAQTDASIGPQFKTKGELLADVSRFAALFGCEGARDGRDTAEAA